MKLVEGNDDGELIALFVGNNNLLSTYYIHRKPGRKCRFGKMTYQKIPEGLVEGYTWPNTGGNQDAVLTATSHGIPLSTIPGEKRDPGTPGEIQQLTKTRRLTSSEKIDWCCNCTSGLTCSTKQCWTTLLESQLFLKVHKCCCLSGIP
jgi:hypothetical protein